jgi:uncharacterized membrane protein YphA (DoxX/SURF4 family)
VTRRFSGPRFVLGLYAVIVAVSVVAGVLPAVGAAALAVFLVVSAVTMHDFWTLEDEDARTEMTSFLKNLTMAAGALAFFALAGTSWPYALNLGL